MRFSSQYGSMAYEVVAPEGPAIDLAEADRGLRTFDKCVYLQVGVEKGDAKVVRTAAGLVHRICRKTDASLVVINAFAGLAERALRAGPEEALTVSSQLQSLLRERGYSVHLMPFGWMKRLDHKIEPGVWEQRFEHVPPPLEWGLPWQRRSPADYEAS